MSGQLKYDPNIMGDLDLITLGAAFTFAPRQHGPLHASLRFLLQPDLHGSNF